MKICPRPAYQGSVNFTNLDELMIPVNEVSFRVHLLDGKELPYTSLISSNEFLIIKKYTSHPSFAPTFEPTSSHSEEPSVVSSNNPSLDLMSNSPSIFPSDLFIVQNPYVHPSSGPTSSSPTDSPTTNNISTNSPSIFPSDLFIVQNPYVHPSSGPTSSSPTENPTTKNISNRPTTFLSSNPPTVKPSTSKTYEPTLKESDVPTQTHTSATHFPSNTRISLPTTLLPSTSTSNVSLMPSIPFTMQSAYMTLSFDFAPSRILTLDEVYAFEEAILLKFGEYQNSTTTSITNISVGSQELQDQVQSKYLEVVIVAKAKCAWNIKFEETFLQIFLDMSFELLISLKNDEVVGKYFADSSTINLIEYGSVYKKNTTPSPSFSSILDEEQIMLASVAAAAVRIL